MEGKSSYFVLLVIVACLSITLAFLAIGYFFIGSGNSSPEQEVVAVTEQQLPGDDELSNKVIFESKNFNLKKTDSKQIAVIMLGASMKHFKITDELKEEEIVAKIDFYSKEINAAFGIYFQELTLDDVALKATRIKAAEDLTKQINEILTRNDKKKSTPLVYAITFDYWFYQ